MSTDTTIEWATKTWGPVLGCKKVSAGCDHCYAIRTSHRLAANPNPKVRDAYEDLTEHTETGLDWTGVVRTLPERLTDPLKWRKPERIFVNSQSDLFHPAVGPDFTARVFATMAATPQHTYQVLTKRPDVALKLLRHPGFWTAVRDRVADSLDLTLDAIDWITRRPYPLDNAWIGVSVEDQATADERIPKLLQIPSAVRWISAEPLLGPIQLPRFCDCGCGRTYQEARALARANSGWLSPDQAESDISPTLGLDWVVVGGESGPGARPMHPDWARSLRDQCAAAGVPMLFKQWGNWTPESPAEIRNPYASGSESYRLWVEPDGTTHSFGEFGSSEQCLTWAGVHRMTKKAAGRELDGVVHDAYPSQTAVTA